MSDEAGEIDPAQPGEPSDAEVLDGGSTHVGQVVRIGNIYSARCPRLDLPDEFEARSVSAHDTLVAVLDGYGADKAQRQRATAVAARFSSGAADFLAELGVGRSGARTAAEFREEVTRRRFLAAWWRNQPA